MYTSLSLAHEGPGVKDLYTIKPALRIQNKLYLANRLYLTILLSYDNVAPPPGWHLPPLPTTLQSSCQHQVFVIVCPEGRKEG